VNGGHVWRRLPSSALDALAQALEAGRIALPPLPSVLERYVGRDLADSAASELAALLGEAFTGPQMARLLRAVAFDGPVPARLELVWSGPEPAQSSTRDTGVVVPALFASAKRSVVVAGFAIRQGDRVFATLATNMDNNPSLDVRIFTNIQRAWKDSRADSEIVREFADDFRRTQWPGRRYPRVLHDRRALSSSPGPRACLHAKCLIVDDERALVTSANFTEAAMDRNIEAGILVEDAGFAGRLRAQFDALERSEYITSVSGLI
jgi:phosphatidylserine/phosphatidylglycerophosphate/cardiolipin synthase-like enzyme